MMDFLPNELVHATMAERHRQAQAIARSSQIRQRPRTVRAALAARLLCLATAFDRDLVRTLAQRKLTTAGRG